IPSRSSSIAVRCSIQCVSIVRSITQRSTARMTGVDSPSASTLPSSASFASYVSSTRSSTVCRSSSRFDGSPNSDVAAKKRAERESKLVELPVLGVGRRCPGVDDVGCLVVEEVEHGIAHVPLLEDLAAVLVDLVALVVQDVVELERALAHVEVACLDLDLRLRDRAGDHPRLDG